MYLRAAVRMAATSTNHKVVPALKEVLTKITDAKKQANRSQEVSR